MQTLFDANLDVTRAVRMARYDAGRDRYGRICHYCRKDHAAGLAYEAPTDTSVPACWDCGGADLTMYADMATLDPQPEPPAAPQAPAPAPAVPVARDRAHYNAHLAQQYGYADVALAWAMAPATGTAPPPTCSQCGAIDAPDQGIYVEANGDWGRCGPCDGRTVDPTEDGWSHYADCQCGRCPTSPPEPAPDLAAQAVRLDLQAAQAPAGTRETLQATIYAHGRAMYDAQRRMMLELPVNTDAWYAARAAHSAAVRAQDAAREEYHARFGAPCPPPPGGSWYIPPTGDDGGAEPAPAPPAAPMAAPAPMPPDTTQVPDATGQLRTVARDSWGMLLSEDAQGAIPQATLARGAMILRACDEAAGYPHPRGCWCSLCLTIRWDGTAEEPAAPTCPTCDDVGAVADPPAPEPPGVDGAPGLVALCDEAYTLAAHR